MDEARQISQAPGRALIAAMRCLAAPAPGCARRRRDDALLALHPAIAQPLAKACLGELAESVAEIGMLQPHRAIFAPPGQAALAPGEVRLIGIIVSLQQGDICRGLEALSRLVVQGQVGRALFPLKSLATRLVRAGVTVSPIGDRRFRVIAGASRPAPQETPPRRAQLRLATSA